MSLFKLGVTTAGSGAVVVVPVVDLMHAYFSIPVWGVPVTVFGAAMFGAAISLFFGDPIRGWKMLFGQIIASAFFGAGGATMAADAMDWAWAQKNMAMFAMMSAAILRWFLPTVIDRGKQFIREFRFSFARKSDGGDK